MRGSFRLYLKEYGLRNGLLFIMTSVHLKLHDLESGGSNELKLAIYNYLHQSKKGLVSVLKTSPGFLS